MRSLRTRSRASRLAVRLATAPEANSMRAVAMSTLGVTTPIPDARTSTTGSPTRASTRSRSWIIRSRITATSEPRAANGATRSDSMNRGDARYGAAARSARLKRSTWPVWSSTPAPSAAATSASRLARARAAIGFSISTCRPRASAASPTSWCAGVGTTTDTASTSASSASSERIGGGAELLRDLGGALGAGVEDADQPRVRERGVQPRVMATEAPHPHDADGERALAVTPALRARSPRRTGGRSSTSGSCASSARARSSAWLMLRPERKKSR